MRIQKVLDSDIVMIFDECTPYPATRAGRRATSMELSLRWAERSEARARRATTRRCSASCRAASTTTCARARPRACRRSASTATRSAAWRSASPRHERNAMLDHTAPAAARRPPALPDGRGPAGGPGRGGGARRRHVRLRDADPQRAQRPLLHLAPAPCASATRVRARPAPDRAGLRLPACASGFTRSYLRHLDRCNEMLAPMLGTLHNLLVLPAADGRHARGDRAREPSPPSGSPSTRPVARHPALKAARSPNRAPTLPTARGRTPGPWHTSWLIPFRGDSRPTGQGASRPMDT